ncbi:hypothetical protein D3C78_897640 [compost metagenome]
MPARKAPSAIDRPSRWVSQAVSSTITSASSTNSSAALACATSWNSRGSSQRLATSRPANSSAALPRVIGSAQYQACSEPPAITGIMVSSSTATRSWNSSTPMEFWPCELNTSPRLLSSLVTMAVDDSARPPPISSAAGRARPARCSRPASGRVQTITCRLPRPNTTRRRASMRGRENSRPRLNSRNTTPNSASSGMSSWCCSQPRLPGPSARPTLM